MSGHTALKKASIPSPQSKPSLAEAFSSHDSDTRTRLHIAPFSPALLSTYLAPSVLSLAANISYHAPQTFPEKGFGYVELPTMEAVKLKKKLNGAILKGSKVHIEDAKPEKRKKRQDTDVNDEADHAERPAKKSKKVKSNKDEQGLIEGVEMPTDRKVKRGWTQPMKERRDRRKESKEKGKAEKPKDKKKKVQEKSEYTKEPELLFRTKVPPNAAPIEGKATKEKKDKKSRRAEREVVVHEFEKSKKHANFLRSSKVETNGKTASAYDEEKGWVADDGQIIEKQSTRIKKSDLPDLTINLAKREKSKPMSRFTIANDAQSGDEEESEDDSSEQSSVLSSSSEDSDDDEDDDDSAESATSEVSNYQEAVPKVDAVPSAIVQTSEIIEPAPVETAIHPLEALFKRPKLPTGGKKSPKLPPPPIKTAFTFFGDSVEGDSADEDEKADKLTALNPKGLTLDIPQTPFSREDMQFRGLRSAAPTPDTAAIGKKVRAPWREPSSDVEASEQNEDEDSDEGDDDATAPNGTGQDMEVDEEGDGEERTTSTWAEKHGRKGKVPVEQMTEFGRTTFWENRAKTNAGWKQRRRESLREKKKRASKGKKF